MYLGSLWSIEPHAHRTRSVVTLDLLIYRDLKAAKGVLQFASKASLRDANALFESYKVSEPGCNEAFFCPGLTRHISAGLLSRDDRPGNGVQPCTAWRVRTSLKYYAMCCFIRVARVLALP